MMLLQAQRIHRVPLYVTTVDMDVKKKEKKCFPLVECILQTFYFLSAIFFVDKQMCSLFIVWVL